MYGCEIVRKGLLDVQLFMVLAHGSSFCRQRVKHYSRVDEIFLHTLQPRVQLLKPHQLSSIWGKQRAKRSCTLVEEIHSPNSSFPLCVPPEAFRSCEINLAENYLN